MRDLCRLIGWMVVDLIRSRVMLEAEIWTLRQQINVLRAASPSHTAVVHEILQRGPYASILGEGYAGLARRRADRAHSLPPSSRRAAPQIYPDLILRQAQQASGALKGVKILAGPGCAVSESQQGKIYDLATVPSLPLS